MKHTKKRIVLSAAALLLSTGVTCAEEIYTIPSGKTTGGIDLTAMSGYCADRILGPKGSPATVTGGLTVSPDSNPFMIFLQGAKLTFSDAAKIESYPVVFTNAPGNTVRTDIELDSPTSFHDLTVGTNVRQVLPYGKGYFVVAGEGMNSATLQLDGETYGYTHVVIGDQRGNARINISKGGYLDQDGAAYHVMLGRQTAAFEEGRTMKAVMDNEGTVQCSMFLLGQGLGNTSYDTCFVTNRGLMKVRSICSDGGRTHFVFAGGKLELLYNTQPIFEGQGSSYAGGYPASHLYVEGVDGNPVDISTVSNRNLCGGADFRPIKFTGNGGFVKRGAGILTFAHNGSYYWDYLSTRFDITGTTLVKDGGLKLVTGWFTPGRGQLVLEGANTTYDLNGVSSEWDQGGTLLRTSFTGATGLGSIINTSTAAACVFFGYNNASADLDVRIGERVNVKKLGSGTLTVGANAAAFAGDMTVEAGTVKLATDLTHLGTVTVAAGATLDVRGHAFSCAVLALDGKAKFLTDAASSVTIGGEQATDLNMPAALTSLVKTGSGTLTVWGEGAVSGGVLVSGGTLLVRPRDFAGKFYRISFKENKNYPSTDSVQLMEFTFVDANGDRIAIPNCFWNPIDGKGKPYYGDNVRDGIDDASVLQPCEAQIWGKGSLYYENVKDAEGPDKLFDNNGSTANIWWYYWRPTWANVVVRLPDDAPAVAGYKMTRGGNEAPITWSLEGSMDGKNWTMLYETSWDVTDTNQLAAAIAALPAHLKEYNNGVPYHLESMTNVCMTPFGVQTPVKVAPGAVYAAVDATTRLDALSVDLADTGFGTVSNFTIAANGVLTIANYQDGTDVTVAPLSLVGMSELMNFKTWSVVEGDVTRDDLRVRCRGGKLLVLPKQGLSVIIR